jgi:hypothetical protein
MPKGKGYRDQFGLDGTMKKAGSKRLSEQPTTKHNVPGAEVSRTVKGMPNKLK